MGFKQSKWQTQGSRGLACAAIPAQHTWVLGYFVWVSFQHAVYPSSANSFSQEVKAEINVIQTVSNLVAELSFRTTWHTCCLWWVPSVLHMICTGRRPGHLSVHVGDSSRRSEEPVDNSNWAFQCNYYYYYYYCYCYCYYYPLSLISLPEEFCSGVSLCCSESGCQVSAHANFTCTRDLLVFFAAVFNQHNCEIERLSFRLLWCADCIANFLQQACLHGNEAMQDTHIPQSSAK